MCNNGAAMKLRTFSSITPWRHSCFRASFSAHNLRRVRRAAKTDDALELVKQGQKLNSEGKQDEALALYDRALQLSPNLFQADLAAGMALDLQGKYQQARQHLAKAIDEAPPASKVQALRTMAVSYAFERNADEAPNTSSRHSMRSTPPNNSRMRRAQPMNSRVSISNRVTRTTLFSGTRAGTSPRCASPTSAPAEKDLWEFRWESALARIRVRQLGRGDEAQKHLAAAKAILDKGDNPDQVRFYPYLSGYVAFYLRRL